MSLSGVVEVEGGKVFPQLSLVGASLEVQVLHHQQRPRASLSLQNLNRSGHLDGPGLQQLLKTGELSKEHLMRTWLGVLLHEYLALVGVVQLALTDATSSALPGPSHILVPQPLL